MIYLSNGLENSLRLKTPRGFELTLSDKNKGAPKRGFLYFFRRANGTDLARGAFAVCMLDFVKTI
jgi:hypothetical protein